MPQQHHHQPQAQQAKRPAPVKDGTEYWDKGDFDTHVILAHTSEAQKMRREKETRLALSTVMHRVGRICDDYDSLNQPGKSSLLLTDDVSELARIMSDDVEKRKYMQGITVAVVSNQVQSKERTSLLVQISDFMNGRATTYIDDDDFFDIEAYVDLDESRDIVAKSLELAKSLSERVESLNHEIVEYLINYANNKGGKMKKKLEKALNQAKEDMTMLTQKLVTAQTELDDAKEKMMQMGHEIEAKRGETNRLKREIEKLKELEKELSESNDKLRRKDLTIEEQERQIETLKRDLEQVMEARAEGRKALAEQVDQLSAQVTTLEAQLAAKMRNVEKIKMDLLAQQDALLAAQREEYEAKLREQIIQHADQLTATKEEHAVLLTEKTEKIDQLEERVTTLEEQLKSARGQLAARQKETPTPEPKKNTLHISRSSQSEEVQNHSVGLQVKLKPEKEKKVKEVEVIKEVTKPMKNIWEFKDSIALEDEAAWAGLPDDEVRGRFAKYREMAMKKLSLFVDMGADGLQEQLYNLATELENNKKLAAQNEADWQKEKNALVARCEELVKLQASTEAAADETLGHLERVVSDMSGRQQAAAAAVNNATDDEKTGLSDALVKLNNEMLLLLQQNVPEMKLDELTQLPETSASAESALEQIAAVLASLVAAAEREARRPASLKNSRPPSAFVGTEEFDKLKLEHQLLSDEFGHQRGKYEEELTEQSSMIRRLEETIELLRKQIEQLNTVPPEYPAIFTRLDMERNERALERAVSEQKLAPEEVEETVETMKKYVSLPSQRLRALSNKYAHFRAMREVEKRLSTDGEQLQGEVESLLDRMEELQQKRAAAWSEEAEAAGTQRRVLADQLMVKLQQLEKQSGLFLVKPYYSFPGRFPQNANEGVKTKQGRTAARFSPPPSALGPHTVLPQDVSAQENNLMAQRDTLTGRGRRVHNSRRLPESVWNKIQFGVNLTPTWNPNLMEPSHVEVEPMSRLEELEFQQTILQQNLPAGGTQYMTLRKDTVGSRTPSRGLPPLVPQGTMASAGAGGRRSGSFY